jgi:hypothetical protein
MPQAVATAITKFIVTSFGLKSTGAALVYAASYAVATLATAAGLAKITEAIIGKPRIQKQPADVEYTGTVEPRRIIYGEILASGINVIPPMTSGDTNEYLHQVLAVAGHECNQLGTVYFNREALGTISSVTGTDNDGKVTTGTYANKAWVRRYVGTDTQTVDYKLATAKPAQWTTAHAGKGIAYIALTYQYDEEVYRTGKPELTCLVQGKKVYDPRLDSTRTGGSGSQRVTDPSTYAYSSNPALCLADYLISNRLGLGEDATRIDWALVMDAADICDELVNLPGSTTQKRYTCNVALTATDRFEDNIKVLAQAMAGVCYYSGGLWRIYAGAWSSSAFTLTDADLVNGGISVVTAYPYNQRYNSVRGQFVNKDRNWQPMEYQPVINTSYVTADGEQAWLETDFAACTNEYEAQRHAILLSRRSRNGQVATVKCGMTAFSVMPFQTGTVTFSEIGWTNKTVRCEGWQFDPTGAVELVLREEASSDWNDPLTTDYLTPTSVSTPSPDIYEPLPPTNLAVNTLQSGFALTWSAPAVVPVGAFYDVYEYTSSTPFSSASVVWRGISTNVFIPRVDTTTRYYWVVLKTPDGAESDPEPPVTGVPAGAAFLPSTLAASVSPSSVSKTDPAASITTPGVSVTATGGTSPYTYAWTRQSGSTSISADSASASVTTFTGTSLVSGSTYNAVFRCTVTDNAAATATVDVSVTIVRANFSASASPSSLYTSTGTSSATTSSTTVTPTGGVAPYTYSWALYEGDTLTVTSPTSASTTFSLTGISEGETYYSTYRCTATDSTSGTPLTTTADVLITIERPDSGGLPP